MIMVYYFPSGNATMNGITISKLILYYQYGDSKTEFSQIFHTIVLFIQMIIHSDEVERRKLGFIVTPACVFIGFATLLFKNPMAFFMPVISFFLKQDEVKIMKSVRVLS
jgi:hypothetical protein